MQTANPFTGRCIHCAFRVQQSTLRSRRLNRPIQRTFTSNTRSKAEYTFNPQTRRFKGRADTDGPIRFNPSRDSKDGKSSQRSLGVFGKKGQESKVRRTIGRNGADDVLKNLNTFDHVLRNRLQVAKEELKDVPLLEQLRKKAEAKGQRAESFEKIWKRFEAPLVPDVLGIPFGGNDSKRAEVMKGLQEAFKTRGQSGLDDRIRYAFYSYLTGARFTAADISNQQALADLRYPSEWFPATRVMHRTIHLHVGPTNSGKTYHALQRLEQAETGAYAGPLRLLAHEVYTRLNAKGKACCLITGEERRLASQEQGAENRLVACTVEMLNLNRTMDVAVVDEIQMIGSAERGWAWTAALMGVKAKEVHLCGEERTVPLIREICASLGEKLIIHHYERLSPLEVAETSLKGRLSDLRKGDCIVSFSVMGIHALRRQIERTTGKKVATVYGSLPPETRAQQARLFNDPDNDYDYLVASDAVGMGLNLAIKRIIFEQASKFDGTSRRPLGVADVKQIAGRAGRYRIASFKNEEGQKSPEQEDLAAAKGEPEPPLETAPPPALASDLDTDPLNGLVTTLEDFDFPFIRNAMTSDPEPITSAGLFPPASVLERFSSYFPPSTPFSYILTRLHELSQMHSRFHLCGLKDQVWVADLIEPVKGLTVVDRNIITSSPAGKTDMELWRALMPRYARCIAEQTGGDLVEIAELPLEILDAEVSASREYLRALEQLHKGIVSYLWLSYRFAGIFTSRSLAFHVKGLVEEKIELVLGKFSFSEATRKMLAAKREKELLADMDVTYDDAEEGGEIDDAVVDVKSPFPIREEFALGRERDVGSGGAALSAEELDKQTPMTFGGDRFGGEEELAFEDPAQVDIVAGEEGEAPATSDGAGQSAVASLAQWRQQETKANSGESPAMQASDIKPTLAAAATEGADAAREVAVNDELFDLERPGLKSVGDVVRDEAGIEQTVELADEESATSPEQDSMNLEALATPEAELEADAAGADGEATPRPMETQEASPTPQHDETPAAADESQSAPSQSYKSNSDVPTGMPPKHLHTHLDVEVKEVGTDVASRP